MLLNTTTKVRARQFLCHVTRPQTTLGAQVFRTLGKAVCLGGSGSGSTDESDFDLKKVAVVVQKT